MKCPIPETFSRSSVGGLIGDRYITCKSLRDFLSVGTRRITYRPSDEDEDGEKLWEEIDAFSSFSTAVVRKPLSIKDTIERSYGYARIHNNFCNWIYMEV